MASIKQRGRSFQVQVRRKDSPPVSKCFKSLTEAKSWARQIESAIDAGKSSFAKVRNGTIPTAVEALTRYEKEVLPHKKCGTKEQSFINRFKGHKTATKALCDITATDIANYRDELLEGDLAKSSVVRHLAVISHLFTIATKEWGYSLDNPALRIRKPKTANARSRRPTDAELKALLEHLSTQELKVFVQLAAETAMRRGELAGLTWEQVDIAKQFVFLADTKNGTSRTIVISRKAADLFSCLKTLPNASGRVFGFTHNDTPSKAFRRAVGRARRAYEDECWRLGRTPEAGYLQDLRLHDMRHEATSSLFERGLSTVEVASITGHKTTAMLMRYTHLSSAHLKSRLD